MRRPPRRELYTMREPRPSRRKKHGRRCGLRAAPGAPRGGPTGGHGCGEDGRAGAEMGRGRVPAAGWHWARRGAASQLPDGAGDAARGGPVHHPHHGLARGGTHERGRDAPRLGLGVQDRVRHVRLAVPAGGKGDAARGVDNRQREGDALRRGLWRVRDRQHPTLVRCPQQGVVREQRADVPVGTEAEEEQVEGRKLAPPREHHLWERLERLVVVAGRSLRHACPAIAQRLVYGMNLAVRDGHFGEQSCSCSSIVALRVAMWDAAFVNPKQVPLVPLYAISVKHSCKHLNKRASSNPNGKSSPGCDRFRCYTLHKLSQTKSC
mmetsp:Transcript_24090/g.57368  ORF Transcript_24090/g.57368 Transcript_24090/m.57368 type:complete len:322 (-) Transcript_24090:166-1131(-)